MQRSQNLLQHMKRLSTMQRYGLLLGLAFTACGMMVIIWPQTGVVTHFTNDEFGFNPRYVTEMVSENKSRVYGVLATLLGAGLIAASLYREKK